MAKKVNIKELARRYTTAVFDLAKSTNSLNAIAKDLEKLEDLIKSEASIQKFLTSPVVSETEQTSVVREIGKSQGFNSLTVNFLLIIVRNGRLQYLREIAKAFRERIAEENGEIRVEVISAQKLSPTQVKQVAEDLSVKTGKKVMLDESVKPEIIGGLIIKIGSKMFDFSIKSRLNKLKNQLKNVS